MISNISAVAIIYSEGDPSKIFIEIKDDGHPIPAMRRKLCFIGGNWIGEAAKNDRNTIDTTSREIREELSLDKPPASTKDLFDLGIVDEISTYKIETSPTKIEDTDRENLDLIKAMLQRKLRPFGDFVNTIPKSVLDAFDPKNTRDGFSGLCSYFTVAVDEAYWERLVDLQRKFGNLSNESITLITSLDQIIESGTGIAFGHDRVLQRFFDLMGCKNSTKLPLVSGITSEAVGNPLPSYQHYVDRYEILKKPANY